MATPLEQLQQAYDSGDLDTCEAIIRRTRSLNGQPSPPFHKLASTVFRSRSAFAEALVHDHNLAKLRPNDPIGYYRAGQDLLNLNRMEEAADEALQGLASSGDHHPSLHLIALKAFRAQSDHRRALTHAKALMDLTPEDPLGFIRACQDLISLGTFNDAETVANAGLDQHPDNADLLRLVLQIADALLARGERSRARDTLNTLLKRHPSRESRIQCRKLLRSGGFRRKARAISTRLAAQDQPPHPEDISELFADHIVLGEFDAAQRLADRTGLLTATEHDRIQSLLRTP
ncbi:MAG: tetratricopeptide repeat protein, partial [Synechococcus sp.]